MVFNIIYSIKPEFIENTLSHLKPGVASMKVSSFRLNGFNNAANNRVSFFVASLNSFFDQNQTSFVLSLIFSNKVFQWVSKMFILVIRRYQLQQIEMKKVFSKCHLIWRHVSYLYLGKSVAGQ